MADSKKDSNFVRGVDLDPEQQLPERDPDFVDFYANLLRIGMTQSDFTVTFGLTDDRGMGRILTSDRGAVRLSPRTFKSLILHGLVSISAFEEKFGEIAISDVETNSIENAKEGLIRQLQSKRK